MSIAIDHLEGPFDGILLVYVTPAADNAGASEFSTFWASLQARQEVDAVGVLSVTRNFSARAEGVTDEQPDSIGPKRCGFLRPFGVALRGEVFDVGLQLVADADVVIASPDALLADTSVSRGGIAIHASALESVLPPGEVRRLALLGLPSAMTARRAVEVSLVDEVVDPDELAGVLIRRLHRLTRPG